MHRFAVKLNSFWAPFCLPQNPSKSFFLRKSYESDLGLYPVTAFKKPENFHKLIFHETWRNSFQAHFGPLLLQNIFFFTNKKKSLLNFNSLHYCNVMQKAEKSHALVFGKTKKPHFAFWDNFGSLLPQQPQNEIFPIKVILFNFKPSR